ncbi:ATP-binding protein, partial [Streptomyces sp. SID89]|nr:ATP-binding protein [Streptomyces sp. SID89]
MPAPRTGVVRGTMERPQLPRRRAQEHIVPQLRGGPAPRQDSEHIAGHDPGLMAAFQRGIGLAEAAERRRDPDRPEPYPPSTPDAPHETPAPDPAPRHDGSASAG